MLLAGIHALCISRIAYDYIYTADTGLAFPPEEREEKLLYRVTQNSIEEKI
jgi:hypothetical protein